MSLFKSFQHFLKSISRSYRFLIAGLYLIGFLILGEVHPFSSYPMYNSFPNWSYTFYFTDERNELIPSSTFDINSGDISHKFYAICNKENVNYGNGVETEDELFKVGKEMTELVVHARIKHKYQTIRLHRIYYKYENSLVKKEEKVIYEKHF